MTGTVLQVNVSRGGIPKRAIPSGDLTAAGIAGDAWRYPFHGGTRKAILLVTIEGIDELSRKAFRCFPGRWARTSRLEGSIAARCDWASACWWVTRRSN